MPRPASAIIVAIFLFLAAATAGLVALSVLFPNPLLAPLWELNKPAAAFVRSSGELVGVFLVGVGCGTLSAGFGLLRGRAWAWWFAVALFAANGAGDVAGYFVLHNGLRAATGVLVSSTFLFLLSRADVRRYFFRSELTPNHNP
ncbi:MAG TPA: hypothetical protein VKQ89_02745 [Candidatus Angelobacter sp.]|nr:hypothetical protein [Candidatus Angelobacter sp.]